MAEPDRDKTLLRALKYLASRSRLQRTFLRSFTSKLTMIVRMNLRLNYVYYSSVTLDKLFR